MSTIQNGIHAYTQAAAASYYRQTSAYGARKTKETAATAENKAGTGTDKAVADSYISGEYQSGGTSYTKDTTKANRAGAMTTSAEYGKVVGEPKLSEAGAKYLKDLKSKYGNMDFVLVSKDMVGAAKSQAASYGNPNRMVVLIDEEKIERMASDEKFREKYEAIISQSQKGMPQLRSAVFQNPNIKSIGINVLDNGAGSFMAACAKNNTNATKRLEERRAAKKAEKKAADKKAEKKKAEKSAEEKKRNEKIAEKKEERAKEFQDKNVIRVDDFDEYLNNDEYEIIYADSMDELISKLEEYNKMTGWSLDDNTGARYTDYRA